MAQNKEVRKIDFPEWQDGDVLICSDGRSFRIVLLPEQPLSDEELRALIHDYVPSIYTSNSSTERDNFVNQFIDKLRTHPPQTDEGINEILNSLKMENPDCSEDDAVNATIEQIELQLSHPPHACNKPLKRGYNASEVTDEDILIIYLKANAWGIGSEEFNKWYRKQHLPSKSDEILKQLSNIYDNMILGNMELAYKELGNIIKEQALTNKKGDGDE